MTYRQRATIEGLEERKMLNGDLKWGVPDGAIQDALTSDAQGGAYVIGHFRGTVDFNPAKNRFANLTAANATGDMFVAKYLSNGALAWVTQYGNVTSAPRGTGAVAARLTGATGFTIWISGTFAGTVDFTPSAKGGNVASNGKNDMFLLGLSETGVLRSVARVGTGNSEAAVGVALDGQGRIYLAGTLDDASGDTQTIATQFTGRGKFIATLSWNQTGVDIVPTAVSADGDGDFFMAGTVSNDFTFSLAPGGTVTGATSFLLKLDPSGTFAWVGQIDGATIKSVATDKLSTQGPYSVSIAGAFSGTQDFGFNSGIKATMISAGGTDGFVARYDDAGTILFGYRMGGTGADSANSVDMDAGGSTYIGGEFQGVANFPRGAALTSRGGSDGFTAKYGPTGRQLYLDQFGGTGTDRIAHVAIGQGADLVATGPLFAPGNYDPFGGTFTLQPQKGHAQDLFVIRLD